MSSEEVVEENNALWRLFGNAGDFSGGVCRDVVEKHVLPRLNSNDVKFLYGVNTETRKLVKRSSRAGDLKKKFKVKEMSSISTLEVAWENKSLWPRWWRETYFCWKVAYTNKLELLKWAREEKKCEWAEGPINAAAVIVPSPHLHFFSSRAHLSNSSLFVSATSKQKRLSFNQLGHNDLCSNITSKVDIDDISFTLNPFFKSPLRDDLLINFLVSVFTSYKNFTSFEFNLGRMCLKLTSSLFTITSHKSLSPIRLFCALVITPRVYVAAAEEDVTLSCRFAL